MSQPAAYNRTTSFTNLQVTNPTGQPQGPDLDTEYNNIKTTLDQVLANLALIQRDDGALANASVGLNQLSSAVTIGFSVPTAWATGIGYVSSPASTVFNGGKFYSCLVSHTSGTFATDLAAAKWVLIADLTAIPLVAADQIAVTASGSLTTDVQGSLEALDAGKAALSHTHVSTAISDSTAAGRAFLTAADLAAQKTLLGLGAQAFVDNAIVTAIGAQLAFTGVISPAALVADTNDWAPTGWATATRVRMSASSAINITGLLATTDGDIKILENIGATNAITFNHDNTGSAAANRITSAVDLVLDPLQACTFMYDATSARWRIVSSGMLRASATQATALTDAGVAITPSTLSAGIKGNYPASSGRKFLATPADGTSGDYTGRVLAPTDMPHGLKASETFTVSGTTLTSRKSYNISFSRSATGKYDATITAAMADIYYQVLGSAQRLSGAGDDGCYVTLDPNVTPTTTTFSILILADDGTKVDPQRAMIAVFGD